jgi:hypothetical protein
MTFWKWTRVILFGSMAVLSVDGLVKDQTISFVSPTYAEVGRPLTPVSVAGVARRTTRRCAADVYDC